MGERQFRDHHWEYLARIQATKEFVPEKGEPVPFSFTTWARNPAEAEQTLLVHWMLILDQINAE